MGGASGEGNGLTSGAHVVPTRAAQDRPQARRWPRAGSGGASRGSQSTSSATSIKEGADDAADEDALNIASSTLLLGLHAALGGRGARVLSRFCGRRLRHPAARRRDCRGRRRQVQDGHGLLVHLLLGPPHARHRSMGGSGAPSGPTMVTGILAFSALAKRAAASRDGLGTRHFCREPSVVDCVQISISVLRKPSKSDLFAKRNWKIFFASTL